MPDRKLVHLRIAFLPTSGQGILSGCVWMFVPSHIFHSRGPGRAPSSTYVCTGLHGLLPAESGLWPPVCWSWESCSICVLLMAGLALFACNPSSVSMHCHARTSLCIHCLIMLSITQFDTWVLGSSPSFGLFAPIFTRASAIAFPLWTRCPWIQLSVTSLFCLASSFSNFLHSDTPLVLAIIEFSATNIW